MKVSKETDIFNLMDTNGRRRDVINALQGYLNILDDIVNTRHMQWKHMPESTAQFHFYEQAYDFSQGVFKRNKNYDDVIERLGELDELREAIYLGNVEWIGKHKDEYKEIFKKIDNGIEDRARHYTSNLVKLGFTDSDRNISNVGEMLLGRSAVIKDEFERMLPINDVNIIYLRQLLKLRIYTKDGTAYYSPFCMALFALLKKQRISQNEFAEIVQSQNPYLIIDDLDSYIDNYHEGQYLEGYNIDIPDDVAVPEKLNVSIFRKNFPNGKTPSSVDKYYEFYVALYRFNFDRTQENLDSLLLICEEHKEALNTAFGYGKSIFSLRRGDRPSVTDFLQREETGLFTDFINENLYRRFVLSKRANDLREKSDTTRRIFKATGIISFDNGYVELAYKELCEYIFDIEKLKIKCMGLLENDFSPFYDCYDKYEGGIYTFFCKVQSLVEILGCTKDSLECALTSITEEFDGADIEEIPAIMRDRRRNEFVKFVDNVYPEDRVKKLLLLFTDRKNDGFIRAEVNPEATVPTIYEYIVGLAWYYFSNKSVDILESFNLTLSADFEPITHAGGGAGDIVIRENDKVVMLEATLMNTNSQKRGEWEPVLRHSVNLKIEEEEKETGREVTTFFIADSFDCNTINIWKAISSVPLQSSVDREKFTDNVIIMPINNSELVALIDKKTKYNEIIQKVRDLFIADETSFDMEWRSKFIDEVI